MPPPEKQKRQLARLCDLIAASLLPHLEAETSPPRHLMREDERCLLIALSRVNKEIQGWNQQEEEEEEQQQWCESDQKIASCPGEGHSCCLPHGHQPYDGFGCLENMVSILVGVLGFCTCSDCAKHSAGNILVSISSALIKFVCFSYFHFSSFGALSLDTCLFHGCCHIPRNLFGFSLLSLSG